MIVADANLWLYRLIESEMTAQAERVWKKDHKFGYLGVQSEALCETNKAQQRTPSLPV